MESKDSKNAIESFDFKALGARMLKFWYLFALSLLIGYVVSYYKIRYSVPTYKTYGKALLKDEYSSWGQEYFIKGMELVSARSRISNEVGLISSYNMMRKVLDDLDFDVFYYDVGDIKTTELYKKSPFLVELDTNNQQIYRAHYFLKVENSNKFSISRDKEFTTKQTYSFNKDINLNGVKLRLKLTENYNASKSANKLYSFTINDLNSLAKVYQGSINLETVPMESSILQFSLVGPTIKKEIDFINALMAEYIRNGLEESSLIATNTIEFVDDQLKMVAGDLNADEKKLEDFKLGNNKDKLQINQNTYIPQSNSLEREYVEVKFEYNFYKETLKKLSDTDIDKIFIPNLINVDVRDPLFTAVGDLMDMYSRKNSLETQISDSSTVYQLLVDQIKTKKQVLSANIESRLLQTKFKLDQLEEQLVNLDDKLIDLPYAESEYIRIDRIYNLNNEFYNYLLQKRSEAAMAEASNVPNAKVIEPASDYTVSYVGIVPKNIYLTNLAIAFILPFLFVLLIFLFNTKIMEKADVESVTDIPIMGTVGHVKSEGNLILINKPKSIIAESFRALRTSINYVTKQKETFKVLITSSISGEGKTFCSINLASAYALSGKRTLLIGADLRKPKIFNDFDLNNNLGLSSYLIGKATVSEVTQQTGTENLNLISSGPIPPNPSELIETDKMTEFFREVESQYDVIIVDTPPVGLVTDALILTQFSDVNLYVIRQRYTNKNHLELINQLYKDKKVSDIGIIVNDLREQKIGYKYGYSYGYGYGYGYSYGYGYGYGGYYENEELERKSFFKKLKK